MRSAFIRRPTTTVAVEGFALEPVARVVAGTIDTEMSGQAP